MPGTEQLLQGLREIANNWRALAVIWHVYFGIIGVALLLGIRPPRRAAGFLIGLPLVSVSVLAWLSGNPFNGLAMGLVGLLVFLFAAKLPCQAPGKTPRRMLYPGIILFAFGWAYPHFLSQGSILAYLYAAPTGLLPCPTLSIAIGLILILGGLGSRALAAVLAAAGLFYGIVGVFKLGVTIDLVLLLGAAAILAALNRIRPSRAAGNSCRL